MISTIDINITSASLYNKALHVLLKGSSVEKTKSSNIQVYASHYWNSLPYEFNIVYDLSCSDIECIWAALCIRKQMFKSVPYIYAYNC